MPSCGSYPVQLSRTVGDYSSDSLRSGVMETPGLLVDLGAGSIALAGFYRTEWSSVLDRIRHRVIDHGGRGIYPSIA